MAGDSEHAVLDCCYKCEDKPHPKHELCDCTACNGEKVRCESCDKVEFTDDTRHWCECADCDRTFACPECNCGWTKLDRKYCSDHIKAHEGEEVLSDDDE
jgi:hypothetical protein